MDSFLQQHDTRCSKRPRQDDYNPGPIGGGGGSSTFEIPKTIPLDGLNHAFTLCNSHYGDNAVTATPADQLYETDLFTQFITMDNENVVPTHIQIRYDNSPPGDPGNDADDTPNLHYTHEYHPTAAEAVPSSVASQWNELPAISRTSVPPPPSQEMKLPRGGPTEQEWEERLPLIMLLYGPEKPSLNLTLQELMRVMEKAGFLKG